VIARHHRRKRRCRQRRLRDPSVAVEFLEKKTYLSGIAGSGAALANIAVTDDPAIQQQPTVAVNPLSGIFVVSRADRGLSWSSASPLSTHLFSGSIVPFDAQPDLAIDTFPTRTDGSLNPQFGNIDAT
jgi:hypothetical protein